MTDLVTQITRGRATPYARARAISDWFADPANNFVYSLKTTKGDSGNDLVDFLQQRSGYCQQYAAAMGVMLRLAGVPSRLVLGYMHPAPDSNGNFKITTFDAHAWVEAFFPGLGWVPFDPTPTAGLTGGKKTDLSYAPHVYSTASKDVPSRSNVPSRGERPTQHRRREVGGAGCAGRLLGPGLQRAVGGARPGGGHRAGPDTGGHPGGPPSAPIRRGSSRGRRRPVGGAVGHRRRPRATYGHRPAHRGRCRPGWAATRPPPVPALEALAVAVEHRRYAADPQTQDPAGLVTGLHDVTEQLRARRARHTQLAARFWPASLGWGKRIKKV